MIHFQDNLSVSDDAKKDKLWKLRPWLQKLRDQFLCIPPEECHAVDEIMVPFKGKSHLGVYMPAKPHKWGFKMWGRAGQSGFLYYFDVCQGAQNPDREKSEVGVTGEVVLKMTSTLPAGKKSQGHCRQLPVLYISSPGATPKRERNPLHWHDPD